MKLYFTSEVKEVLHQTRIVENLARKKFIASFVLALIESQKVQFKEIAHYLNEQATLASNECRIQPGRRSGLFPGGIPRLSRAGSTVDQFFRPGEGEFVCGSD